MLEKPKDPSEYIKMQPKTVQVLYNISRTTLDKYMRKMLASPYKDGITRLSHNLVLIDRYKWDMFLQSQDMEYLK